MESLVEVMLSKVNILSILDCYYRLFPLIYIRYDCKEIMIQGSCEERWVRVTTTILRDSLENYECKESMVLAAPFHLKSLGGRCISIKVLKMDSWRVKNVFKSSNGVSYEVISSYMYNLKEHPKITECISFERYPSTKKFLLRDEDPKGEVEVEVNEGIAMFEVEILCRSKFIVGEPGEPSCKIPIKHLKLLNKFLGMTINNSKIEFCMIEDKFLFSVDKEHYRIDYSINDHQSLITH